jgi:hypothetical protein
MRALTLVVLGVLGVLALDASAGEIYRWVDAQGNVHFSDEPPPHQAGSEWQPEADGTFQVVPQEPPAPRATPPRARVPAPARPAAAKPPQQARKGGATQQEWRRRSQAIEREVSGIEKQLEALDEGPLVVHRSSRQNGVWWDQENTAQRRARLERELEQANRDLEKLQDKARRAGVPPGWLRD